MIDPGGHRHQGGERSGRVSPLCPSPSTSHRPGCAEGLLLAAAFLLAACPPSPSAADSGPDAPLVEACAQGFEPAADGVGCDATLPATACPPGTRARLGFCECQPVGWTSCPAGFETDPSGWGCAAILPATPCTGATRAALGSRQCVPVGDCAAPFPPANATVFVDAAGPLDATHFHTISEAVAAAPPDAVIAVEAGTYTESLLFTKSVTVVGRCAERVVLSGGAGPSAALRLGRPETVAVRGLSVVDHLDAVALGSGGRLSLDDCVLEKNRSTSLLIGGSGTRLSLARSAVRNTVPDASGAYAVGADVSAGATLELVDTDFTGHVGTAVHTYDAGSLARLTRSVVADTLLSTAGLDGRGFAIDEGSRVELTQVAVLRNHTWALVVDGTATLTDTLIADTLPAADGELGRGVEVSPTGRFTLTGGAIVNSHDVGLIARGQGSSATLTHAVLRGTTPTGQGLGGVAFTIRDDATLVASGSAFVDNVNAGGTFLEARVGGEASLSDCLVAGTTAFGPTGRAAGLVVDPGYHALLDELTFDRNTEVSLYVEGRVEATALVVLHTAVSPAGKNGVGVAVNYQGALVLERALIAHSETAGIEVLNAGTTATIVDTVVRDSAPQPDGGFGHGLIAEGLLEGGPDVTVRGSRFTGHPLGGGLLFAAASARISRSLVDHDAVGIHVQQGSRLVVGDAPPDGGAPFDVVVSTDTRFVDVTTRVGVGELALPDTVGPHR